AHRELGRPGPPYGSGAPRCRRGTGALRAVVRFRHRALRDDRPEERRPLGLTGDRVHRVTGHTGSPGTTGSPGPPDPSGRRTHRVTGHTRSPGTTGSPDPPIASTG